MSNKYLKVYVNDKYKDAFDNEIKEKQIVIERWENEKIGDTYYFYPKENIAEAVIKNILYYFMEKKYEEIITACKVRQIWKH